MEKEDLPKLEFSEFDITLRLDKGSPFLNGGFPGATVRGAVMFKAKKLLCANPKLFDCKKCLLAQKCVYARLFETVKPSDSAIMKKYTEIPHPFVLTPILSKSKMNIRIMLFGEYTEFFPYFYLIFKSLEEPKQFSISSITNFGKEILKNGTIPNKFPQKSLSEVTQTPKAPKRIKLHFITPLRIKSRGKYVNQTSLNFEYIVRNLLRRLYLLSYFYGKEWKADFKEIIEKSKEVSITERYLGWLDLERFSMRSKTYMSMGGIVGSITLSENAAEFLPLLKAGEYIHIGKNTSFGHGYYKIE